jgi:hypothetical protein
MDGCVVSKENMNLLLQKLSTRPQQTAATISLQSATLFSSPQLCFEDLIKLEMSQEMKRQRDADELVTYKKNTRSLGKENSQEIRDLRFISATLHYFYPSTLVTYFLTLILDNINFSIWMHDTFCLVIMCCGVLRVTRICIKECSNVPTFFMYFN